MIGSKLGPYEIREEVGRGGMATVYRAYQPNVDRDVAIKVIHGNIAGDNQAVQRFQREARLIARLEHPHILPVYDFDGTHDPPYIVMRFLDGGTLKDVMQQGRVPLNEVVYVMQQITAALDYAHRQGIVHRDVKPNNIMIDRDGNAFVTDLGIARIASADHPGKQLTATGVIMGTPDYMSPEQALGEDDVDYRTDIYALGAMLFHMLTGQLPYTSASTMGMLMMHIQEPTPFALEINRELPPEIDDVIHRAMAKKPAERYETMAEMGAAITEALGGMTTSSPQHLRQVASSTVIRQLDKSPTSRGSQSTPSEQNKQVTALYANAAEYAAIVDEAAGGEASRRAVREFWDACEKVITGRGGTLVSRTDNEIMVLWGAEFAREDDAERAIFAAVDMQETLHRLGSAYLEDDPEEPLPLNIGINTGLVLLTPAIAGGTYTASGATVSLANRLMQAAEGAILVTHDVYRQVRGVFSMATDEPLKVRGSKAVINTYRITGVKARAFRVSTRGVEGIETQMVGREAEFKLLQNAFLNAVEDSETQVVTIISDAGIGKSRLLYEFSKWSDLRPETYWILRGRSTASSTERPYALIRDLISFRFEILDSDSPTVAMKKLEEGITSYIGKNDEMAHLIGYLCGFDFADSPHIKGLLSDPAQLASRARQLFIRFITALTKNAPAVMELEDIHHADDASLDLLIDLFSADDELQLLVLCLARPALFDRRPGWGSGQHFHRRIELKPLDKRESRDLVREILQKVEDVPRTLRDLLVDRAEGNPYYMEELIKMLIDDRVIIKTSDEVWHVEESRLGALNVPYTLLGLLEARLDTLLYPEKLTLQRASVIGRIFYDSALYALDDVDETHIADQPGVLAKLVEREFIYKRETTNFENSEEYIFSGNMLRDSLYNALLRRQVKTYNRAAADWLKSAAGSRASEYAGQIADYYEKGGDTEEAGEILFQAAGRAYNLSAYADARRLLERAQEMLPEDARIALKMGEINFHTGDFAASIKQLETVLQSTASDAERAEALAIVGETRSEMGEYLEAVRVLEEALPLVRRNQNLGILARVLYGLGDARWRLGHLDQARESLNESLEIARQINDPPRMLYAMNRLGTVLTSRPGGAAAAEPLYNEAIVLAQQTGNREREMTLVNNMGEIIKGRGNLAQAVENYRHALDISREIGAKSSTTVYLLNLGDASIKLGDIKAGREHLREALSIAVDMGAMPWVLGGIVYMGWLAHAEGDPDRMLQLIGLALNHPAKFNDLEQEVDSRLPGFNLSKSVIHDGMAKGAKLDFDATVRSLLAQ